MRLLIACDMEGITGVVAWNQVDPGHAEYLRFRHIMTADVNAAIRGALASGVDEIIVSDGHWNKTNVLAEELHPTAHLVSGTPAPLGMVEGIQQGVDCVFFVGYHARNGTRDGILCHTWSRDRVSNVWLNDRLAGEFALNASVVGEFGAPVLMVSGDLAVCTEAGQWVEGVQKAVVKTGVGYAAAELLLPSESQQLIEETASRALALFKRGNGPAPLRQAQPVKIRLEFFNTGMADGASLMPGVTRLDGRTIEVWGATMVEAYAQFRAAVALA